MKTPLRILHIEDNVRDAELVADLLHEGRFVCKITRVESREEFSRILTEKRFDLILSDFTLPSFDGLSALRIARETCPDNPFIFVSATIGEEAAIQSLLYGATDYVLKNKMERLVPAVQRAVKEMEEKRIRKAAEETLRRNEETFRLLFASNPHPMWVYDLETLKFLKVNDAAISKYGYSLDEFLTMCISDIRPPEDVPRLLQKVAQLRKDIDHSSGWRHRLKNGNTIEVEIMSHTLKFAGREAVLVVAQDVTERKRAEEKLRESERRYRQVVESATDIIYTTDKSGHFLDANPAALQVVGYSHEELRRFAYLDLILPERRKQVALAYQRQYVTKAPTSYVEFPFRTQSGEVRWFGQNASLRILDGKIIGFSMIARDITDRKRAEESLAERERQLQALVTSLDDIVFEFDEKGTYLNVWAADESLLARPKLELLGRTINDILGEAGKTFSESVKRVLLTGETESIEYPLEVQGRKRWLLARINPITSGDESRKTASMLIRDITDRKLIEDQMRQAQKFESLGTLAGGIAHDFNNILGIIMAHSTLVERGKSSPADFAESIKSITKATHRGASLVKQLLTFARKSDVVLESVRINETVQEVVKLLNQTLPKTITIGTKLVKSLPSVVADATQMHQVLLNLCVNARDAMPRGGTLSIETTVISGNTVRKKFAAAEAFDYVQICVADTGTGMDEQTRSRIFEPFFTTKGLGKGTGLGLATVFGIVQTHRGFIDLATEMGWGTTFFVYLPVQLSPMDQREIQSEDAEEIPGGSESILLIEDEEDLLKTAKAILRGHGYRVLTASDGAEGVRVYTENKDKVELVVTDMGLPKLDGSVVFTSLRNINPTVKVILASGFVDPEVKSQLFKHGMKDFIQKPYQPDQLLKTVREVLDSK